MWSMPEKVLQIVAAGILGSAVLGFTLGVTGAGPRSRLPGASQGSADDTRLNPAADALPINLEETPPPKAAEPEEEEEAAVEDDAEVAAPPPTKVAEAPPAPKAAPPAPAEDPKPAAPPAEEEPLF